MALRRLARLALVLLTLLLAPLAAAEGIAVRSASLVPVGASWVLDADLDVSLNPTLEEALTKGVTLYFVAEFELVRPRSYWFGETEANFQQSYKLRYNPLTRQYQLTAGMVPEYYNSLEDARRALGQLQGWRVADRANLKHGNTYRAGVSLRLDTSRLPKPLLISTVGSKDWNLDSGWYYWNVQP